MNEEAGSILPPPPPPMPRSRQSLLGGRIQVAGGGRRVRRRMSFLISDCSSRPADATHFTFSRRSRSRSLPLSSENVASSSITPLALKPSIRMFLLLTRMKRRELITTEEPDYNARSNENGLQLFTITALVSVQYTGQTWITIVNRLKPRRTLTSPIWNPLHSSSVLASPAAK